MKTITTPEVTVIEIILIAKAKMPKNKCGGQIFIELYKTQD